jgi:HAD superfamily hydrolase (TIGR01509 family)
MNRRGVLFDVDGTLVDTTYLHAVTWWEAFRQVDLDVPMARIHRAIGMGGDKILDHLLGAERDTGNDEKLAEAHSALYAAYWERLRPLPGAVELVRACADRGLTVVFASSASEQEFEILRRTLGVDDVVTAGTNKDDVERSKPDPDIVGVALERGGLTADDAVFVGDAVWDVLASARLGLNCIGVECGGTGAAELRTAGAVAVYEDPAALLAAFDDSPLGRLVGR